LGVLKAGALSPDWKWLAVSEGGRGAVWDLSSGNRLYHVRGFQGAYFPGSYVLYADFPKFNETPRCTCEMSLAGQNISEKAAIDEKYARQYGEFLVIAKTRDKPNGRLPVESVGLEIRDVPTGATLWSREFPKGLPDFTVGARDQRMALWWPLAGPTAKEERAAFGWAPAGPTAKEEMENFPAIREKLAALKDKPGAYLLEFLDARTGKNLAALAVETGNPFGMFLDPHSSGDWVTISDGLNRVLVYSLSSGNEVGRYFGNHPVLSAASGLLCLENESGHFTLYDLNSGQDLDRWVFSSSISLREFSPDGKRLFVLTADQTSYVLDVSTFARASEASAPAP
jgi:hypothetical protein